MHKLKGTQTKIESYRELAEEIIIGKKGGGGYIFGCLYFYS